MHYEMMFPDQIRKAIQDAWPVVLAVGVLEYHAEHCALGTDTLIVNNALETIEQEMDMVVLPPLFYGTASYSVAAPENNGTLNVSSATLHLLGKDLFGSLLRVGFRHIHVLIWHQTENFTAGMPTDLALKLAARESIFEHLERTRGEGWWGKDSMRDYYAEHDAGTDPFNWVRVHALMSEQEFRQFPADHAGKLETSLLMAMCPDCCDLRRHSRTPWYAEAAAQANPEYGRAAKTAIVNHLRRVLGRANPS